MNTYNVTVTFTEPVLGTVPKNEEIYTDHVLAKAVEAEVISEEQVAEELETLESIEQRGWTGFHSDENGPFLYSYMVRGFFKKAAQVNAKISDSETKKHKAYIKIVNDLVFVEPRRLYLQMPDGSQAGVIERPLRAQTPQGDRVALVKSDTVPAGTVIQFQVCVLGQATEELLREWLDYGRWSGIGQWRNGGYGRFTYTMEAVE